MGCGSSDVPTCWFPAWAECAQANGWPLPSHSSEHVHSRPLWCVYDSLPSMRDRLSDDGGTHDDMPRRHCIDRILAICAFRVSIELYMCLLLTSRSSMSHDVLIASRNSEYFHFDRSCFCLPISCCCARTFSDLNISKEWESFNITLRLLSKYDFSSGWLWTPRYIYTNNNMNSEYVPDQSVGIIQRWYFAYATVIHAWKRIYIYMRIKNLGFNVCDKWIV